MKDNKFRIWDDVEEVMSPVLEMYENGYKTVHNELIQDSCFVMQYIGLKDRKDVEIYEGDIVLFFDKGGLWNIGVVEFFLGQYVYRMKKHEKFKELEGPDNYFVPTVGTKDTQEVKANIYENPKYIEGIA